MTTRYGLHAPHEGGDLVREQIWRSHRFRKALSEERPNEVARANRQLAATSTLSEAIVHAARARGRICMALPAAYTTRICPCCGVVENRKAADSILLHCDACGATWDQDRDGATRVLLTRLRERPGDGQILVGARVESNIAQPSGDGLPPPPKRG